ncbi:MAG: carboxypeptidase-like regulatory domain-containing protein [Solirubrobacteraceae bacterium]
MVTATVALVVGFGVLSMVDRTGDLSGEQRTQAIAGNLAQVELDTVKAMPLSQLSNMRRSTTQRVSGVDYSITTRGDWVNDTAMAPNCTTAGASADYLKIQTTVTHPTIAPRSPVVLDTIISPPVRSFSPNQGSLAVLVTDRAGAPVPGLSVSLTGPATFTDDTNANGCVLWGYLPAGSGYTLAFSKAGYVTTDGSAGGGSASVAGDATTNVNYQFDRGGSFSTSFKVKTTTGALIDTRPSVVRVENGTGSGFSRNYDIGTASSLDTAPSGLLFPFTSPYAVYADNCAAAKPTSNLTAPAVTPGTAVQAADTILPALHVTVQNNGSGAPVNNATVRVVTACGTLYTRQTNSQGRLADPGFPFGTGFRVCATNGTRKRVISSQANTSFANAGTPVTLDIGSSGSTTTNPNACP